MGPPAARVQAYHRPPECGLVWLSRVLPARNEHPPHAQCRPAPPSPPPFPPPLLSLPQRETASGGILTAETRDRHSAFVKEYIRRTAPPPAPTNNTKTTATGPGGKKKRKARPVKRGVVAATTAADVSSGVRPKALHDAEGVLIDEGERQKEQQQLKTDAAKAFRREDNPYAAMEPGHTR